MRGRGRTGCRGTPCGRGHKQAKICPHRSSPRDTAQEQPFDVLIHYRFHPRAGERVGVVRRLQFRGSTHFVIDQPDGTRGLLPAWMADPGRQSLRQWMRHDSHWQHCARCAV